MLRLEGVALTSSGRPVLAPEELELKILENCDLEFDGAPGGLERDVADKYVRGVAFLTTHRLIWLDQASLPTPGRSCSLRLERITKWGPVAKGMFSTSKAKRVRFQLRAKVVSARDDGGEIRTAFRGEPPDAFTKALAEAMLAKAWLAEPPVASSSGRGGTAGRNGGGGGGGGANGGDEKRSPAPSPAKSQMLRGLASRAERRQTAPP